MKGTATALCAAVSIDTTDGDVPEWVHLLPAGELRTADGRGPYRVTDVIALMAASMKGGKLVLDENHATDLVAPKGGSAPARGWIVDLQHRADGIWGRVEWTAEGRSVVPGYRGISPAIVHRRDGTVLSIARASLTNTPNFQGLQSLHSKETSMDFRAWLIEALGLAADVDDDAIVTAMKAKLDAKPDDAVKVALQSALSPIALAAGVAADADAATVLAGVQQLQGSGDAAVTSLQSELRTITTRFNALVDTTTRDRAVTFVDGAIAAGRVGVRPQRDEYISMHMENPARAEKLIGGMPILKAGSTTLIDPPKTKEGLSAEDQHVVALMGLDPVAYAATLAEEGLALA